MKVPNLITLSRLCLAPAFLYAFLEGTPPTGSAEPPSEAGLRAALALACFFEVTDMVDGAIARRMQQVSQLGKILDPLADSVSRFTVFLAFLTRDWSSVWVIAPIFWRDSIVSTIRVLAASQGVIVSARFSGKLKAVVQGIAIVTLLVLACFRDVIGWDLSQVRDLARDVMTFVAAVTTYSLFDYLWGNRKVLKALDA